MSEQGKELTTTGGTEVTGYEGDFDNGLGELDAGDLIIPRLTITQPTTPDIDEENIGKFCINVTGDFHDKMTVVLVKLTKSRILFPDKYKRDNDPLCRSHNFKVPANDIEGAKPMCDSCEKLPGSKKHQCEYANWTTGNTPPKCQETWNLLVVDVESYMPMWFSLKSTALKPLRKIVSAISMMSSAKRIPMWGFQFEMELEKTVFDSGTAYLPVFSGLTILEEGDRVNMDEIRRQLADTEIQDSTEPDTQDVPEESASRDEEEF